MKSYIIPNVEHEPGAIVIHCRTNDLRRQGQLEEIACEIANLASSVKSKKNKVVSGIIPRQGVCQIFFRNFIVFKGFFSIFWLFFRVLLKIPSEYLSRSTGSENFQTNIKIEDSLTKNGWFFTMWFLYQQEQIKQNAKSTHEYWELVSHKSTVLKRLK